MSSSVGRGIVAALFILVLVGAVAAGVYFSVIRDSNGEPGDGGGFQGTVNVTFASKGTVVGFEAESAEPTEPMRIVDDPGASGGKCIEVPEGAGKPETADEVVGEVIYKNVEVPESGDWYLWCHADWWDACGNSLTFVFDPDGPGRKVVAVEDQNFYPLGGFGAWHWVGPFEVKLAKGSHAVAARNREDGIRFDGFILTSNRRLVPQGKPSLENAVKSPADGNRSGR